MNDISKDSHDDVQRAVFLEGENALKFGAEYIQSGRLQTFFNLMFSHLREDNIKEFLKSNRGVFEYYGWTAEINKLWAQKNK